jgi:hypothetical protein
MACILRAKVPPLHTSSIIAQEIILQKMRPWGGSPALEPVPPGKRSPLPPLPVARAKHLPALMPWLRHSRGHGNQRAWGSCFPAQPISAFLGQMAM